MSIIIDEGLINKLKSKCLTNEKEVIGVLDDFCFKFLKYIYDQGQLLYDQEKNEYKGYFKLGNKLLADLYRRKY